MKKNPSEEKNVQSCNLYFLSLQRTFHFFFILVLYAMRVCSVTRSCPTLCDAIDYSPPDSSVHGLFQARILEWVAISSSGGLPIPGFEPASPVSSASPALAGGFFTTEPPGKCTGQHKSARILMLLKNQASVLPFSAHPYCHIRACLKYVIKLGKMKRPILEI